MSRIGKKPVSIPQGVKVELKGQTVKITGAKESLVLDVHADLAVAYDEKASEVTVTRPDDERFHRAVHGTTRSLIANMVTGVTQGFSKSLQVYGTGYGVKVQGKDLLLTVGLAQPVTMPIPPGVSVDIKTPNTRGNDVPAEFSVSGADKCVVGQFAAEIRRSRPTEPYKGKGVRYLGEHIRRKVGKAFGSAG